MHTYRLLNLTPKGRDEDGLRFTWNGCATTTGTSRRRMRSSQRRRLMLRAMSMSCQPIGTRIGGGPHKPGRFGAAD